MGVILLQAICSVGDRCSGAAFIAVASKPSSKATYDVTLGRCSSSKHGLLLLGVHV
jgi:hypothetical protein